MSVVGRAHSNAVFGRRVRVLAQALGEMIPSGGTLLDVGCGDGSIGHAIAERRPDLSVSGLEVLVRSDCRIAVDGFDGRSIPLADDAVDFVMLVDVLHHAVDPIRLLGESVRTARKALIVKDHLLQGLLAGPTLKFMDWVGNAHHGVALPYDYWAPRQWEEAFDRLGLEVVDRCDDVPLYPFPASLVFGRGLHFVARLQRCS